MSRSLTVTITPKRAALAVAGLVAAGLAFGWSGLFNVAASTGHWRISDWFLHWVMINSVETYTLGVETPDDLDDPALIARGAGHYASGCASCHGAPGRPRTPLADQMTPAPPDLGDKIPTWEPKHLFWIVRNGVKFSGMPAWISHEQRPDEAWAMAAFLLKLPAMSPQEYGALAFGREAEGSAGGMTSVVASPPGALRDDVLADCARCHGRDGRGRDNAAFPVIAGQSETYLYDALRAYADGKRHSGIMQPAAARVADADLRALAAHYAAQSPAPAPGAPAPEPALIAAGERIAREGVRATGIPACGSCHGGPQAAASNPAYPSIAGQHASYLAGQLALWEREEDSRGGGPFSPIMRKIAFRLTAEEIAAVSAYYASLPPGR